MSFVDEEVPNIAEGCAVQSGFVNKSSRFPVTSQEIRYYTAVCTYSSSAQHSNLKFFSLGDSLAPGGQVCTFVINCMCRKLFLDERPTVSFKHYFFSCVSLVLMSDSDDFSYIERCFSGAASVLPLPLCEMLFFPVLHGKHWFLFVVDLKEKFFLFLDSYYSKDDEFTVQTRRKLIFRFRLMWDMFVGSDVEFHRLKIAYPHVPKQNNTFDCGVFLIKFMELYHRGADLRKLFSLEDIPNIRIQIVNDLVMCQHNKANTDLVRKFQG